jgi:hypothetical protein
MKRLAVVVFILVWVALFALALALRPSHAQVSIPTVSQPASAIGMVNEVCTGEAISPTLFITASHCVESIGDEVKFYIREGVAKREYVGINVWDSFWDDRDPKIVERLDLSIVRAIKGGTFKHYLSFNPRIPSPNTNALNISMSVGLEYWTRPLVVQGMYHHPDLGWVLVYRGDIYPGASGSVVLVDGKIVGMVVYGIRYVYPGFHFGETAGRIMSALRDLQHRGEMVYGVDNHVVRTR